MNTKKEEDETKTVGVLQALLYGIPEPETYSYVREMIGGGGIVGKVLYGVKDAEEGEKRGEGRTLSVEVEVDMAVVDTAEDTTTAMAVVEKIGEKVAGKAKVEVGVSGDDDKDVVGKHGFEVMAK